MGRTGYETKYINGGYRADFAQKPAHIALTYLFFDTFPHEWPRALHVAV